MTASRLLRWVTCTRASREARGATAVEFALLLPVLVMLLLGILTSGLTYSRGISLSNAVREGARFGATGDATTAGTWATDVISRVRTTQIDDSTSSSTSSTAICVQLWKVSSAGGAAVTGSLVCDQGNFGSPALAVSNSSFPAVPSGMTTGTCVVQVLAARKFKILLGVFPSISSTMYRGAVARYERSTC
jgi:Flp pilus assembly protein TadG